MRTAPESCALWSLLWTPARARPSSRTRSTPSLPRWRRSHRAGRRHLDEYAALVIVCRLPLVSRWSLARSLLAARTVSVWLVS